MNWIIRGLLFILAATFTAQTFAQGILIDIRPDVDYRLPRPWPIPVPRPRPEIAGPYKIKELGVNVNVNDQVAKVQVSQSFVNTSSRQIEVCFVFPLPYDGAVDRLTFMVDGKEYDAKLLPASEARAIYESYIRRNQDPALLEWIGTGLFKTSVFPIPPGAERTVTLRYSQVCRKHQGLTEFFFPLSTSRFTSQPIEKVSLNLAINSSQPIKNVYSPSHAVEIKRPGDAQASISFTATGQVPTSDFRLLYDVGDQPFLANVISYRPDKGDDGYYLLLASPRIKRADEAQPKKTVVLVVDRSGSMSGEKIDQAKAAVKFVLNQLHDGDLFNIVAFDSTVESFKPELQKWNQESRAAALGFVEGIYAGGATNIDGALKSAFGMLQDASRPNYVIFLTDGHPTATETNEQKIVQNAKERNGIRSRVFVFGVGYDLNSRLLDKLARTCFGQSEYVRPKENIEEHVARLSNRIGSPALSNVVVKVDVDGLKPEEGAAVNRVYPKDAYDLFAGDQLVIAGRYKKPGAAKVTLAGSVDGKPQQFDFPAQLVESSGDETYAFVEKIWATRRVGEILDQIDLNGKNDELVRELVALATKHGILTPYTSFLADDHPSVGPPPVFLPMAAARGPAARERAADELESLKKEGGEAGVAQRAEKNRLLDAKSDSAISRGADGKFAFRRADRDEQVSVDTIMQVGAKTFYRRGQVWVDSAVSEEQLKQVKKVVRYSPEYFDLAARLGREGAKYLAIEGEVLVLIGGQAYSF